MEAHWLIYAILALGAVYMGYRLCSGASGVSKVGGSRPNIVLYYASWCPASRAFLPAWKAVGQNIKALGWDIDMNSLNCDGANNPDSVEVDVDGAVTVEPAVCNAYGIDGYPSVILYNNGQEHHYEGARTPDKVITFIREKCGF